MRNNIILYISLSILLFTGFLLFYTFYTYLWALFLGLLIYTASFPIYNKIHVVLKIRSKQHRKTYLSSLAASLTIALVVLIFIVPIILVLQQLSAELLLLHSDLSAYLKDENILSHISQTKIAMQMQENYPSLWNTIILEIEYFLNLLKDGFSSQDTQRLFNTALFSLKGGVNITLYLFSIAWDVLIAILVAFFLFQNGRQLTLFFMRSLPYSYKLSYTFIQKMDQTIKDVIYRNGIIALMQGAIIGIGLSILGFDRVFSYSLIAAIFSVIPFIGTGFVWIPAMLHLAIVQDQYLLAGIFGMIFYCCYLGLENIIKPKILDAKLKIHPMLLFLALLGGLSQFGILGIMIGPIILILFRVTWNLYHTWNLKQNFKKPALKRLETQN